MHPYVCKYVFDIKQRYLRACIYFKKILMSKLSICVLEMCVLITCCTFWILSTWYFFYPSKLPLEERERSETLFADVYKTQFQFILELQFIYRANIAIFCLFRKKVLFLGCSFYTKIVSTQNLSLYHVTMCFKAFWVIFNCIY